MEKEKNNKVGIIALLVVIIVILLALVVLLATGTISFKSNETVNNQTNEKINDDITNNTNENTQQIGENQNGEASNNSDSTVNNIDNSANVNKVFISENNNEKYLILWDDGTYKYTNGDGTIGTLGRYSLNNKKLVLYYMFSIDSSNKNKVNVTDGSKILKVVSQSQIIDGDITLNSANQPAREGAQNFYTNLYSLLKYYDDEQKNELGIK